MAWELSLNYEAMYPDKEPLIPMRKMKLLTSVEAEATKFAERTAGGRISEEDLESVDREIDFISATDPNARSSSCSSTCSAPSTTSSATSGATWSSRSPTRVRGTSRW